MESKVKSRYEVISELETQKRQLIFEKNGLDDKLKYEQRELRDLKREVEDKEESIEEFKGKMKEREETALELIKSIDESLARFTELTKK